MQGVTSEFVDAILNPMPRLVTIEMYNVRDVVCHVVDVTEVNKTRDPRSLCGEEVILDGKVRRVRAVEAFCVAWEPGRTALNSVSIVVD